MVTGATGGLGRALVSMLREGPDCTIGAHGATRTFESDDPAIVPLTAEFSDEELRSTWWKGSPARPGAGRARRAIGCNPVQRPLERDERGGLGEEIDINLNHPLFLARAAMRLMKASGKGGHILLTGTESALHGGSPTSFPYAVAKRGTEAMVEGLREKVRRTAFW